MVRTTGSACRGHGRAAALVAFAAVLAATLIAWVPGATPASAAPIGTVTNYGRVIHGPIGVAIGLDGNMWYTNRNTNTIGTMTTSGTVLATYTGDGISAPHGIAAGPDGALWFANSGNNSIGRITTAGIVTNFTAPGIDGPTNIINGPDANLWFTNWDSIGRITTAGVVTIFTDPTIERPSGITGGQDGNVWFTNWGNDSIGRVTPAGVVANFTGPGIDQPMGITAGPGLTLWFTNNRSFHGTIGSITTAGVVANWPLPDIDGPAAITLGLDNNLWFTTNFPPYRLGRMTTAGAVDMFESNGATDMHNIISGPDGNLWFTSWGTDWIGRSTTAGVVTNLTGTTINRPYGIARGVDGNMWFTNSNGKSIGRITPAGVVSSFTTPGIVRPHGITSGPDGNLWFTDKEGNQVGRITTAGVITLFTHASISGPHGITTGPDGALWFTNIGTNTIGRITTAGVVTNAFTDATISAPHQITLGPDGALWFTNRANASIGRITTAGVVTNYTGTGVNGPYGIATGPDGNLWFTNSYGNSIGRITPAGVVSNFVNGSIVVPYDIVAGPDGNLWYTSYLNFGVGRITPAGVVTPFKDTNQIKLPFGLASGGDGTLWFTNQGNYSIGRIVAANLSGAPTGVIGSPGNTQVAVSWAAPVDNGGSAITGYTVTSNPGSKTCTTTGALTCTVTGLTNGTAYTFTVKATNGVGVGPASAASAAVTPFVVTAPGAPTGVTGSPGNAQVAVSWLAPASNGGSAITGYTVTSNPGSKTCTTTGALTCTVTGLTNGTAYTFTVKASNVVGAGPASSPSAAVTPAAPTTAPGAPTGVTAVAGKQRATVSWSPPASNGGSPITGYAVTATPGGATCTTTGALSCAVAGLTAGTSYTFTVKAANVVGQGPASAASTAVVPWDGSGYHPVTPVRILDSRFGTGFNGKVLDSASRSLQVTGLGGPSNVPPTATAVVMNVTVADATNESFLTVFPTGTAKPNASNLNFGAGQIIPNLVTVKLGTGGKVEFANAVGGTNVIADVVGYYDDGTVPGDLFTGITPVRLLDSRTSNGGWVGPLPAGTPRDLVVRKPGNANGVPATATAVVANVTVTGGTLGSFVSVWPSGEAQPNVSNLNFGSGQTIPNLVTVKIGAGGAIRFANAVGSVEVIVDVVGYFDPTSGSRFHALNPKRILDTRFGNGLSGPQAAGQTRALAVAGAPGTTVPAGATGLVANVTVADGTAESFVSVFPGNVARPNPFSNLNFGASQVIPNLAAVGIAPNGSVNFYNHLGATALIADAVGYYAAT